MVALLIPLIFWFVPQVLLQIKVNSIAKNVGYGEIVNKKSNFTTEIKTTDSTTLVISYLPSEILTKDNFNDLAAQEAIAYVEKIAKEDSIFTFNPLAQEGPEISVKMMPGKMPPAEHIVILYSDSDPIPEVLEKQKKHYQLLSASIDQNKTFFWTERTENGSVSFLRFAESKTWAHGLPMEDNKELSVLQQLNMGFNIEIWKRSVRFIPVPPEIYLEDHEKTLFGAHESLWNTFGRIMVSKQEDTPIQLLIERLNKRSLSSKLNTAYYPYDEKAQAIYDYAPSEPIIK